MNGTASGIRRFIDDVTKLEVNTIIKDNMTARKMPDPANAILDVAQAYAWWLAEMGVPVGEWLQKKGDEKVSRGNLDALNQQLASLSGPESDALLPAERGAETVVFPAELITIDAATFICLRWAASTVLDKRPPSPSKRVIVDRIRRNSDQLKNLLARLLDEPSFEKVRGKSRASLNDLGDDDAQTGKYEDLDLIALHPQDSAKLRKIWEIGVEDIVAQTTIQIDADVVNRISRRYVAPDKQYILEIHRLGIETSVGFWKMLIEAVGSFIANLAKIGR